MFLNGVKPPYVDNSKRVIIDFSSPNIAKGLIINILLNF
jgi:arginyl-tRNA synthetase